MSAVVFVLENRPGLNVEEARDIADLLEARAHISRDGVAVGLADEIRRQAGLDPDRPPTSQDIELNRGRLEELSMIFEKAPELIGALPAFANLRGAVRHALVHAERQGVAEA